MKSPRGETRAIRKKDMTADDFHDALRELRRSLNQSKDNRGKRDLGTASAVDHKLAGFLALEGLAKDYARDRIRKQGTTG